MRLALEPDILVVGEAGDTEKAINDLPAIGPDVVLMDIELPGADGIAATAWLHSHLPGCAVIMLSIRGDRLCRERAREAGAAAFIEKQAGDQALLAAIRSLGRHERRCTQTTEQ